MIISRLKRRLRALFHQQEMERELSDEMQYYVERQIEVNLHQGMGPAEARTAALKDFGGLEQSKENCRDARGVRLIEDLSQDLRYGARMLLRQPGFTLVAVLTLALGIGANTAIFSVVNAVLLRPLPYYKADRLIFINDFLPGFNLPKAGLTEAEALRLRAESRSLEQVSFYVSGLSTLTGTGETQRISSGVASADFFFLLGVQMALGRAFTVEEEAQGHSNVVILSSSFWRQKLAANPGVLGQALTLDGRSVTIIGVLPQGFKSPLELQSDEAVELWLSPAYDPADIGTGSHGLKAIGRLREGQTLPQARAEANTILAGVTRDYPSVYPTDGQTQFILAPLTTEIVGDVRQALLVLLGGVAFVLLIACANVANLLLTRGEARQKEMAIRTALGAGRARIVRQLVVESLLLALTGGSLGLLLASQGLALLRVLSPGDIPRLQEISLDRWVLGFTLLVSILTGVIFGLAPALQAFKFDLYTALKDGRRSSGSPKGRSRLRDALVVAEVALSLLLLAGSGLLIRSFWRLEQINLGFRTDQILTMQLSPSASAYPNSQRVASLYESLLQRVQSLPGVKDVAVASAVPIGGRNAATIMQIEGQPFEMAGINLAEFRVVSPGYFRTMGVQLVRGRLLEDTDQERTTNVAVINETLARAHWPQGDPLGRRIRLLDATPDHARTAYLTIVGVVADAKNGNLKDPPGQEVYVPMRQREAAVRGMGFDRQMSLAVRASTEPKSLTNAIREDVWALDRTIPITEVRTMEQIVATAVMQPRFNTILLGIFAAVALILAAVGIYGVTSYAVTQRTHEIGIRMALGARPRAVQQLVIGQGMVLALIGLIIGLVASFGLTRLMIGLLYGVSPTDPVTFGGIALVLSVVAALACYIPARRAAKVDPIIALRCE